MIIEDALDFEALKRAFLRSKEVIKIGNLR